MLNVSSENLAVGTLFAALAVLACLAPVQSDTWWLLRAGQDIYRTWTIPLTDNYSHTATGAFWPNHEWLTELVFYVLYRSGGLPLLVLTCATVLVATWHRSWVLTSGAFEVRFGLFALSLLSSATGWAIRPQVFTLAAVIVLVSWIVERRYERLPVLFLLWVNLHGAVPLGLAVLGAATLAEGVIERRVPRRLCIAFLACIVATLVSPLGLRLWSFIPESMERSRASQLIEWLPPDASPPFLPFWIVAALLAGASAAWLRRADRRTILLSAMGLALLVLALQARRNVPVFLLVGVPALGGILAGRFPSRPYKARAEKGRTNAILLALSAGVAAAIVLMAWTRPPARLGWQPISTDAVGAIRACGVPIYNTYADGGIVIWFVPDVPVFIDNRQDQYSKELLQANKNLEMDGSFEALFNRYAIACAAVPTDSQVARRLRVAQTWRLRFADDRWAVFGRSTGEIAERRRF